MSTVIYAVLNAQRKIFTEITAIKGLQYQPAFFMFSIGVFAITLIFKSCAKILFYV